MLCLKKRRTYSFTQGSCQDVPRRPKDNYGGESLNMAITTLPRKNRSGREKRPSTMVLTVTEDTPADMLAGSMELLVQLPRDQHLHTQRVTVQRSTPMMDLLVQIATAHKLAASSYTLQAIGERGLVLPHQPNTPIGALDALQVQLLPKQATVLPRKTKQSNNQPFETTFRLQVHLPRNQLYVSRVSPRMNLGNILDEVCREKNLDRKKYELRHPANLEETLDLGLTLQDYHLQEVTLYAKQGRILGSALSSQDIMALQRQEERRRQQAKQSVFGFIFKKSKESSLSSDSLGGRSVSPARSDETGRSASPLAPPARPQRKRRQAPKPPAPLPVAEETAEARKLQDIAGDSSKMVISHSRNSSDSSGYHEASVLSDNNEAGRLPETLPRRKNHADAPRKLAQTSHASKSLCNLAAASSASLGRAMSNTSLSSAGLRKKRAAPPPPVPRPLSSAMSTQALERIVDSEESLTSDIDPSKPPSDIGVPSKANSDIDDHTKASSDLGVAPTPKSLDEPDFPRAVVAKDDRTIAKHSDSDAEPLKELPTAESKSIAPLEEPVKVETASVSAKRVGDTVPLPTPRKMSSDCNGAPPKVPKRRIFPPSIPSRSSSSKKLNCNSEALHAPLPESIIENSLENSSDNGKIHNASPRESDKDSKLEENLVAKAIVENDCPPVKNDVNDTLDSKESEDVTNLTLKSNGESRDPSSGGNVDEISENRKEDFLEESESESLPSKFVVVDADALKPIDPENHADKHQPQTFDNKIRSDSLEDRVSCTVISTIPKCDHLESIAQNISDDNASVSNLEAINLHINLNRSKVGRSQSVLNDFEVDTFVKQKRHLTSHAEDFACALNLNLPSSVPEAYNSMERKEPEASLGDLAEGRMVDGFKGISDENTSERPSKTDILLQKVSDTLSNTVTPTTENLLEKFTLSENESGNVREIAEEKQSKDDIAQSFNSSATTVGSQQDTSDYVSAVEDLSISDWEYQLPAPPSAFRDSSSPVLDNYDTITLRSTDAIKEPIINNTVESDSSKVKHTRQSEMPNEARPEQRNKPTNKKLDEKVDVLNSVSAKSQNSNNLDLKREMISELESKLETGSLTHKDHEYKRTLSNISTPKVAPIDNTLSNFTITTYTRQRSFDTLNEDNKQQTYSSLLDIRSHKTLPTGSSMSRDSCVTDSPYKNQSNSTFNQKNSQVNNKIIMRSKSNVSPSNYIKFSSDFNKSQEKTILELPVKKESTEVTSLNLRPSKCNTNLSQWRQNTSRQEEPAHDKQLQSLEVLKSILPQLKNAQQREENVPEEYSNKTVFNSKGYNVACSRTTEANTVSLSESQPAVSHRIKKGTESMDKQKRYTYAGPPTITLNSWSERPSKQVQIKMDADYKFGVTNVSTTGSKTALNVNTNKYSSSENTNKFNKEIKNDPSYLTSNAKKVTTTHATPSTLPRQYSNITDFKSNKFDEKPPVNSVEKNDQKESRNEIDTSSMNFKELTKTFGQDICFRTKPKWTNSKYRHSDYFQSETKKEQLKTEPVFISSVNDTSLKPRRFTSIIGINNSENNSIQNGGVTVKSVLNLKPVSVAKEVYIRKDQNGPSRTEAKVSQPPTPPTMPIITGVTLKNNNNSYRPKSMPIQVDSRNLLLESIRNFGGRDKLKSTAVRN